MTSLQVGNVAIAPEVERQRLEELVAKETDFGAFQVFSRQLMECNPRAVDWVLGEARRRFCRVGGYSAYSARLQMLKSQLHNAASNAGKVQIVRQALRR